MQVPIEINGGALVNRRRYPTLLALFSALWRHRFLILQMNKREVIGRYRGSMFGLMWSFFNPVLMLAVYTFVFGVVFKARWSGEATSKSEFAMALFAGMIVHGLFAECVNRAPGLIVNNVNYVKKVVFPLEILAWVTLGSALFHAGVSLVVLLAFYAAIHFSIHWTAIFVPLLFIPLALFTIGLSWFLSSVGVFIRDIGQAIGVVTTIMLFLSPVFYPVSALPNALQPFMHLNPLTFIIEEVRAVALWGHFPNVLGFAVYLVCSVLIAWAGFVWFQTTRRAFADVL